MESDFTSIFLTHRKERFKTISLIKQPPKIIKMTFVASTVSFSARKYGVNSWTKSSIRHVERHVVTFRVRRNFAIRQRSNSSRRLPSLTSRVSLRALRFSHVAYVLTRYMSFRHVVHTSSTRRAYLFDASCIPRPLRRDV